MINNASASNEPNKLFRPCIDLHEGEVKQVVGATLHARSTATGGRGGGVKVNFVAQRLAVDYADIYMKQGLLGGHIIMLDGGAAKSGAVCAGILEKYRHKFHVGGGVTPRTAERWLARGAKKVILTSALFTGRDFSLAKLKHLAQTVGRARVVVDLSCRRRRVGEKRGYQVMLAGWRLGSHFYLTEENLAQLHPYVSELLVHATELEGRMGGIDRELIKFLGKYSPIPTVYAGGVRSLADIAAIKSLGRGKIAFTVGSGLALYGGKLALAEVVRAGGDVAHLS